VLGLRHAIQQHATATLLVTFVQILNVSSAAVMPKAVETTLLQMYVELERQPKPIVMGTVNV
jgi:hypothetical protein